MTTYEANPRLARYIASWVHYEVGTRLKVSDEYLYSGINTAIKDGVFRLVSGRCCRLTGWYRFIHQKEMAPVIELTLKGQKLAQELALIYML